MQSLQSAHCVYSVLGDDPDLAQLVELFVDCLPPRVESLRSSAEEQDWKALGRAAHQLKGSGHSYGFDEVATFAARLEDACQASVPDHEILAALDQLLDVCDRVRAGSR